MSGNGEKRRGPMHFPVGGKEKRSNTKATAPKVEKPREKAVPPPEGEPKTDARAPLALPAEEATVTEPDFAAVTTEETGGEAGPALTRPVRWPVRLLAWAASLLATLAVALALDALVRAAFARADWLGWLALGVVGLAALATLALMLRELAGLLRLRRMVKLHRLAEKALAAPEEGLVNALARRLRHLYRGRPDMRWALSRLEEHDTAVMSPEERLRLLELELMTPLDAQARRMILRAARDVAALTAIAPGAALDMIIVLLRNLRLLRQLAALYGGRPGFLGGWKLLRMVLAHLAVTGALALSDAFLPHVLGKGLAGRLSARFGEGVLNGVLTARIGLAALEQVRPMPFSAVERPGLRELAAALVKDAAPGDGGS